MDIKAALDKHFSCNWGDVQAEEWSKNDEAFKNGGEIISRYLNKNDGSFLIISDADRFVTTILLSCEQAYRKVA